MANPEPARRGRPKGQAPKGEVIARENEVVKLRRGGLPWSEIAQRVGYADPSGAKAAFDRANRRIIQDDIEEIRTLETERLDYLQAAYWGKAIGGDLHAAQYVLRVIESRRKLLGVDAPIRQQIEMVTYDGNAVKTELERILASRSDSGPQSIVASGSSESEPTTTGE